MNKRDPMHRTFFVVARALFQSNVVTRHLQCTNIFKWIQSQLLTQSSITMRPQFGHADRDTRTSIPRNTLFVSRVVHKIINGSRNMFYMSMIMPLWFLFVVVAMRRGHNSISTPSKKRKECQSSVTQKMIFLKRRTSLRRKAS